MLSKKKDIRKFATFMDRFGILAFIYVIFYSIINLRKEVDAFTIILLLIGMGGLLVDSFIVTKINLKNVK
tara:strand:- start:83 stop:292 length:210 start_codon:yes stop_codon:yes gene_type:complete